jgi:hypothetical protein
MRNYSVSIRCRWNILHISLGVSGFFFFKSVQPEIGFLAHFIAAQGLELKENIKTPQKFTRQCKTK